MKSIYLGLGLCILGSVAIFGFQNCSKFKADLDSTNVQASLATDDIENISLKIDGLSGDESSAVAVEIDLNKSMILVDQPQEPIEFSLSESELKNILEILKSAGPTRLDVEVCAQIVKSAQSDELKLKRKDLNWQSLGEYTECDAVLDLPIDKRIALITLIWKLIQPRMVKKCPMFAPATPACQDGEILVPIRKNNCLSGFECKVPEKSCPDELIRPFCPGATVAIPIRNPGEKCISGFICEPLQRRPPKICPAIMAVAPNCPDGGFHSVFDEEGCLAGYACNAVEAFN